MKIDQIIRSKRYSNKLNRWKEVMLDWRRSGMRQREYCQSKQISYWSFKSWRVKLKRQRFMNSLATKNVPKPDSGFIPIKVTEPQNSQPSKLNIISEISIKTKQGHEIKLSSDFNEGMIVKLLRAFRLAEGN